MPKNDTDSRHKVQPILSRNISVDAETPVADALAGAQVFSIEVDGDLAVPSDVDGFGMDTPPSLAELAADLRRRAASCRKLSKTTPRWLDQARLDGKAAAYEHAAELAEGAPVDLGPEVQL